MLQDLWQFLAGSGIAHLEWRMLVMWVVVAVLMYLAVYRRFEPLLLVPIAFGALLANLPTEGMVNAPAGDVRSPIDGKVLWVGPTRGDRVEVPAVARERPRYVGSIGTESAVSRYFDTLDDASQLIAVIRPAQPIGEDGVEVTMPDGSQIELQPQDQFVWATASGRVVWFDASQGTAVFAGQPLVELHDEHKGGLFHYISLGIVLEIFPPLIFLGVGALTDFGPLIANPRMLLLGAAAQFGVFFTFLGATFIGFTAGQAGAISIIGGADGPTSIFLANKLAPELLAPIAVAAYSYMALVPVLQPPIMRLLTTQKERKIRMSSLRKVGRTEKMAFALLVTVSCILLVPSASALIGMLMFGNFLRECGVTERLSRAAQNELINVVTIFLGVSVGITMTGDRFLRAETLYILGLGVVAFGVATASGVLMAKIMNVFCRKNLINPLIGSAGVSAVPMAARVSQVEGQRADANNFLLMHAMGPNVAGVIGTALVAGYMIAVLAQ